MTLIEQEPPTASDEGQLFVWENTIAPLVTIDEMASGNVPVFDSVRTCATLVVPTRCVVNVTDVGEKEAMGAGTYPVPESDTNWAVENCESSWMVNVPVREPAATGVNTTFTMQL